MSNIIYRGQGTGKTKELLLYAKDNNAVVITKNARALAAKAHAYGIIGLDIEEYNVFDVAPDRVEGRLVVFHKLDEAITEWCEYFGCGFDGGTMTNDFS